MCFLLGFSVLSVYAVEDVQFYTSQFSNAKTVADQLLIVKTVVENYREDSDALAFSTTALKHLLEKYPHFKTIQEIDRATDIAWYLTELILSLGSADSSNDPTVGYNLWQVIKIFSNPFVKANAIIALGVIKDQRYFRDVVQILKDCTTSRPHDKAGQLAFERIAFAAITALEAYGDPKGYLPVFFASHSWYTGWLKKQAAEALPVILADPTEVLIFVIQHSEYSFAQKKLALQTIDESDLPDEKKSQAAVAAIFEGWFAVPQSTSELVALRKLAIDMINRYGVAEDAAPLFETKNITVLWLLDHSYRYGADEQEQRGAIAALATIATDASTKQLARYLNEISDRLQRGTLTKVDERYVRDIILAIGSTANASAKTAVLYSLTLDWSRSVQNLLNQTVKQL
jgi:HEAT repeat protein